MSRARLCGLLGLVAALVAVLGAPATAQVRGTIFGPGVRQYPIAVSEAKNLSPGAVSPASISLLADVLTRDLEIAGLFRPIARSAHIERPDTSGITAESINFDNWSVIGALALVKGSVVREGGDLVVELRLFDVSQRTMLTGRRYRGREEDVRRIAHRFADEIMQQFTGERGPFDSRIAFLSTRGGRFKDAYVTSLDAGDIERVTEANTINLSPSWSPDGNQIVLTSFRARNPDLFAVDVESRAWRKLSDLRGLNLGGRWSPNGDRLAVTIEFDGNSEIAILGRDGGLLRRLTDHWAIDVSPSWSPDGTQLAFCSSRAGSPQIFVMDAGGGTPRRVTFDGSYNTSPAWSPKGDRIAYASRVGGRFQIFTMKLDGTEVTQVTRTSGDNEDASWSPDGRYLVFSSTRKGTPRLYVSDRNGYSQVELTADRGGDTSPSWSWWRD
jgi:TolB protein